MSRYHIPPSEEQQERFLELIAEGKTRQEAAEQVEATSTQFRTFINGKGEASLAFAEKYVAALEAAGNAPSPYAQRVRELEGVQLAHRLLDETILRALDSDRGKVGASNRMLYNLSLLSVEHFKPLLEARVRHVHEGAVGVYAMPQVDTAKWTLEQHRRVVELRRELNDLLSLAQPDDAKPRALEASSVDEVIEGEAEEIEDAETEAVA